MDKKDIYEHLAKIYLDASYKSTKKKKKAKPFRNIFKGLFLVSLILTFFLSIGLFSTLKQRKNFNSEIALVLLSEPAKINFNFDPAKKEIYSLSLNKLNLDRFKALAFTLKKINYKNTVSVKAEFANAFKERSEVYLKAIPDKWKEYRIRLSEFKNITDWSEMLNLAFIVEEWNTREKKGVVYVDNIRFLK